MISILLTLFLSSASAVLATTNPVALPAAQCRCDSQVQDAYEEPVRFNFGPFSGQCVNSCRFRRVIRLSGAAAARYGADAQHQVIANFLHQKKHWIARIPVGKVVETRVAFEEFLPRISHMVLRFRFSEPIRLYPQYPAASGNELKNSEPLYDLIFSAEGVPPKGRNYDFFESSLGRYFLGYRLLSLPDMKTWMLDEQKHQVRQFRLNLKPAQMTAILESGIQVSDESNLQSVYQLFTNNCATSAMNLLEHQVGEKPVGMAGFFNLAGLRRFQRGLPVQSFYGTLAELDALRLVSDDPKAALPNLEEEAKTVVAQRPIAP